MAFLHCSSVNYFGRIFSVSSQNIHQTKVKMSHVAITYDPHSFIRHTQVGFCSVELVIASSHSSLSQRHTLAHVCWEHCSFTNFPNTQCSKSQILLKEKECGAGKWEFASNPCVLKGKIYKQIITYALPAYTWFKTGIIVRTNSASNLLWENSKESRSQKRFL